MRIMAVDPGDVRTGVAISDITRTLTGQAWVISCKKSNDLASLILQETEKHNVSCIIIGYPKNMDGSIGERAKKSELLAETLASLTDIQVKLWDERLTTKSAHNILTNVGKRGKKRKQTVDAVAASLILESYLASLSNGG